MKKGQRPSDRNPSILISFNLYAFIKQNQNMPYANCFSSMVDTFFLAFNWNIAFLSDADLNNAQTYSQQ